MTQSLKESALRLHTVVEEWHGWKQLLNRKNKGGGFIFPILMILLMKSFNDY
jgi:hypothetical protein